MSDAAFAFRMGRERGGAIVSDARDALVEEHRVELDLAYGPDRHNEVVAKAYVDALPAVTFSDECATCHGTRKVLAESRYETADVEVPCPDCPEPRHALAVFAVEQDAEAVIAELRRAGLLREIEADGPWRARWLPSAHGPDVPVFVLSDAIGAWFRALPDEVQTDG